ncbi:putative transposase [Parvibaculum indicum]|uniref:RNA-guided endonuclease InsQ/TnpB family protein n=1 Tax=Parvibaculum TaxID=256616 RepID=UPI001423017A|nr:RNA-guided endonuclease TnpB family protein [Parvibaculum sp.]NIJ41577.1 putative transposase [Parvibaculum indicum]
MNRAYRYRLKPTDEQAAQMRQFSGVVRLVYNLALEQRRDWWRQYAVRTGKSLTYVAQARELTELRRSFDWIAAVSQTSQQQALRDLDRAYANFFAGRSGYPTPRRRGVNDGFRFHGRECRIRRLNRNWGAIHLPKIGEVRFRWTRDVLGDVKNVTVSRDPLGWHVSIACEVESEAPEKRAAEAVGIDRGVAHTLAFSDGTFADLPLERLRVLDRRARKQARSLARCRRGSKRREKAKARLARTKAKTARVRKHWVHERSAGLARRYGTVVTEDLKVANMTASARGTVEAPGTHVRQKAGLNRSILEQGWYQFETCLRYKLEAAGGVLIKVPAAYTSQTCSECGSISKTHRKSQAVFLCSDCGHSAHADTNAARNILRAGTRPSGRAPVAGPTTRESRQNALAAA